MGVGSFFSDLASGASDLLSGDLSLGDAFDQVGSFVDRNKSWMKPVVSTGLDYFRQQNEQQGLNQYADLLRQREDRNFQQALAQLQYENQAGAANAAARSRASAAAAAAARATEANRQAAAKKANKFMQQQYKQLLAMYAPYKATADKLLPQMTETYEGSLGMQNMMSKYLQDPRQMAKLEGSVPAYNINVPIPDYARLK